MKKFVLSLLTVLVLAGTALAFSNVPETHWAYDAVHRSARWQLVNGYPDGTFSPEGTLTRAEFLAMCVRTSLVEDFTAESGEAWWKPYYDAAVREGWKLPFSADAIGQNISRFEIAALLDAAVPEYNRKQNTESIAFSDAAAMQAQNETLYKSVPWAAGQGLITGYPDGSFGFDGTLTRAEAATVICRLGVQNRFITGTWAEKTKTLAENEKFAIYAIHGAKQVEIVSRKQPEGTEISRFTVPVALEGPVIGGHGEVWPMTVLNSNSKYFWGHVGFYEYFADGTVKQWTDMPVIDYGYDAADGSFVFITHGREKPMYLNVVGDYIHAGTTVVRMRADGTVGTLLEEPALRSLTPPETWTYFVEGLVLTKVAYATGGQVRVHGEYKAGHADLWRYMLEVKNGAASIVPMGAGNGYSY